VTARDLVEVAGVFLRLGCLSFGGPVAHLGFLRAEFVEKRRWLDDARYGDLVALCQFLPGPASSQVVFALGMLRAGLPGALVASACFTLPSALLMIGVAYGLAGPAALGAAGWLHGLKLAAVAVVAQAVWNMGRKLCPDGPRVALCGGTAAVVLARPGAIAQLGVIAFGGLVGWWLHRGTAAAAPRPSGPVSSRRHVRAASALATFGALLVVLPMLVDVTGSRALELFDSFYRSGALVFGGGHVVLPLLRAELVPPGWISDDRFLAGYAAAQALPGPLFAFASYLGTAMSPAAPRWLGGFLCLFALFLPAWLLIGGALPFWNRLRTERWARAALAGANAAVVGVLLAALWNPVVSEGVRSVEDALAALVAFMLLERWRAPPWSVVAACAAAGQWILSR
jgi:chromate transporter